jgi:hypothetical protein
MAEKSGRTRLRYVCKPKYKVPSQSWRSRAFSLVDIDDQRMRKLVQENMFPAREGRSPEDVPVARRRACADEDRKSAGSWAGTGTGTSRLAVYRLFRDAREFVWSLNLKSRAEWVAFCKDRRLGGGQLPKDIPAIPDRVYAGRGWKGYGDWLGTGNIAWALKEYRSFEEARAFVQNLDRSFRV